MMDCVFVNQTVASQCVFCKEPRGTSTTRRVRRNCRKRPKHHAPCRHSGPEIRRERVKLCKGQYDDRAVLSCAVYDECVPLMPAPEHVQCCQCCPDWQSEELVRIDRLGG